MKSLVAAKGWTIPTALQPKEQANLNKLNNTDQSLFDSELYSKLYFKVKGMPSGLITFIPLVFRFDLFFFKKDQTAWLSPKNYINFAGPIAFTNLNIYRICSAK